MNKVVPTGMIIAFGCVLVLAGCNSRPGTPKTKWYGKPIKTLAVDATDPAEVAAVTASENARLRYRSALVTLANYYGQIGDVQKTRWANRELKNLDKTQEFTWEGISTAQFTPESQPANQQEAILVEDVIDARKDYRLKLDKLAQHLEKKEGKDAEFKAYVVHTVQARFHPEETFLYIRKVELPPKDLEPSKIIPEANAMYDKALALYRKGKEIPAVADYEKQRQALELFQQLVRQYPKSTKIAMAAFYIAEIYKEYFREHYLAAKWYELAWTWDPYVAAPARFQCAVQYDFNLDDKNKALELYRASLKLEPYYPSHVRYAKQRIKELEK